MVGWVGLVGAQAVPASLGVSASRDFDVNSLAVPRKAKESIGAIAKLSHKDGKSMVINVEYNQLDPLLRDTTYPKGDVNDASGFSPFPGNLNQVTRLHLGHGWVGGWDGLGGGKLDSVREEGCVCMTAGLGVSAAGAETETLCGGVGTYRGAHHRVCQPQVSRKVERSKGRKVEKSKNNGSRCALLRV